jgi:AbrB family looped-hinge helix DNA binding protein
MTVMTTSKITSKGQTTIPKEIREALHAGGGDTLAFEPQGDGTVMVRKVQPFDLTWHDALSSTFADEWNSPEDEEAFRDL